MKTVYKNLRLSGELTDITVEDGIISHIGKTDECGIDMHGWKVYPGLIDTHVHGCIGQDTSDRSCSLSEMSEYQLKNGITTWYPTTVAVDSEELVYLTNRDLSSLGGANMPGYHMEGPFLNPEKKGAINAEYIIPASRELFNRCNASGLVKKMTLAPEVNGNLDVIPELNTVVSVGHTTADYDTARRAFKKGAVCLTHTYNVMPGIHHREPGPIGAGADSKGVFAELICDGIHIHPSAVRMLIHIFGEDRVVFVSDSIRAAGLSDGEYDLGGIMTTVKDGIARTPGGNLAGSTANLFDCVKRAISFGIKEESAVKMATENPARLMGLNKGKIAVGFDADMIFVNDDFELLAVVLGGEVCR